ncbi:MAG: ribonuclease H-like domain-containing protein [Bacteroidales bacterium]|nr:ribonuclease H-like domain-containing protein [Clostridium sp.]MCM1203093.1 ribonuclease H-like domain-containing protein [Bacteroidales bacterium]
MKTIQYTEDNYFLPEYFTTVYPDASILFFDIETTGFVAKNTTLYLIGVLWHEQGHTKILQWFNEDGCSEGELLSAFEAFSRRFTHLVHFNGLGFDLPYLKQKADLLRIPFSVDKELTQIDILKEIRPYKKLFSLENMKQVTLERFLGIKRDDIWSGGDLINLYQRHVACPDADKEQTLLLHNHDDLLGMPQISRILCYKAFFEQGIPTSVTLDNQNTHLAIHFQMDACFPLPRRIALTVNGIYLNAAACSATLQIPIFYDTLKHYFPDYQNYYYLPKEDMAIHKSVAAYVESENKQKAKKSTCYIKKTDAFIPCPNSDYPEYFSSDSKSKSRYQLLTDITDGDDTVKINYIRNILATFI